MKKLLIIIFVFLLCACTTVETKIVYKNVYPELPQLESPLILSTNVCKFTMPKNNDDIFIGYDKENFKCYLKNQEIIREQKLLYEQFIQEINNERLKWNELNKKIDK